MKNRTILIIIVVAAFGGDFCLPASAQSAVGGVKKQTSLAAPVKQTALGGPAKPITVAGPVKPGPLKPSPLVGTAKPSSPVVPVNKPGSVTVSPSPLKCPAPCVAKGAH
jgi:hypothetical protein